MRFNSNKAGLFEGSFFSEIFLKLTPTEKKTYAWACFEIKLQAYSLKLLLKKGSCTGVFL